MPQGRKIFRKIFLPLALLAVFPLFYAKSGSGIIRYPNPDYPGKLYQVFGISFISPLSGWLAGYDGHIWKTTDWGRSWSLEPTPTNEALADIQFKDQLYGWAVGYGGTILHTSSGGKTWVKQKSPFDYFWKAVWFKNRRCGWIVGEHGTILSTQDSGTTWHVQVTGEDVILNSIAFAPEGRGWAVGEFGVIYTTPDGKTWVLQDKGAAAKGNTLWSVCYTKNGVAVASGIASTLIISDSKGRNWQPLESIKANYHNQKSLFRVFYYKNKLIVCGQRSIFYSSDMGATWKAGLLKQKLPYGECLYDVSYNNHRAWIMGTKGTLLYSTDGINWKQTRK